MEKKKIDSILHFNITQYVKSFLKCASISIAVVLGINIAVFLFCLLVYGLNERWDFHLKHAAFSVNERVIGLKILELEAIGLMMVFFIAGVANEMKMSLSKNQLT